MDGPVERRDIENLTRALAESVGAARVIRVKLEAIDGPLATLAAARMHAVEVAAEASLEAAHRAAEVALCAGQREPDG